MEEPPARRSGRATKGQHRGKVDASTPEPRPKKSTSSTMGHTKQQKDTKLQVEIPSQGEQPVTTEMTVEEGVAGEGEESIIRCVCGMVTEDPDDERKMICCEACEAWQHNECMKMSENDDELPEQYFCERCRPQDHRPLLAALGRGKRPKENSSKQRDRQQTAERELEPENDDESGAREALDTQVAPSVRKSENRQLSDVDVTKQNTDDPEYRADQDQDRSSQALTSKRKAPSGQVQDHNHVHESEPVTKVRKASNPAGDVKPADGRKSGEGFRANKGQSAAAEAGHLQTELVKSIGELKSADRQRVARAIAKILEGQVMQAQQEDAFSLPEGQQVADFAQQLALNVEYAIYLNFFGSASKPSSVYGEKFRMIYSNIKINPSLRNRLLSGSLSPNELSKMSSEDMASKELQEKKAEMLKEAEKQHMLIQESGPRIRRTHKGDEVVGDVTLGLAAVEPVTSSFIAPIRTRASDGDTMAKDRVASGKNSQSPSPMHSPQSPLDVLEHDAMDTTTSEPRRSLSIDTRSASENSPRTGERRSASAFNIDDVWSGVRGPPQSSLQRANSSRAETHTSAPPQKPQDDADIDSLLRDEEYKGAVNDDDDEDEPYSPVEYDPDTDRNDYAHTQRPPIWNGKMLMAGVASFDCQAKHAAGADMSSKISWAELIPETLFIQGRIDITRADEYLCGLRYSNSNNIVVLAITCTTTGDDNQSQFDKLFTYFIERKRYGVMERHANDGIKDVYAIPLEKGITQRPGFVELLEPCNLQLPLNDRTILLAFVVKSTLASSRPETKLDATTSTSSSLSNPPHASVPPAIVAHPQSTTSSIPTSSNIASAPYPPQLAQTSVEAQTRASPGLAGSFISPPLHSPFAPPTTTPGPIGPTGIDAARQALGQLAECAAISELLKEAPMTGVQEFSILKDLLHAVPAAQQSYDMLKALLTQKLQEQGPKY